VIFIWFLLHKIEKFWIVVLAHVKSVIVNYIDKQVILSLQFTISTSFY